MGNYVIKYYPSWFHISRAITHTWSNIFFCNNKNFVKSEFKNKTASTGSSIRYSNLIFFFSPLGLAEKARYDSRLAGFLYKRCADNNKWLLRWFRLYQVNKYSKRNKIHFNEKKNPLPCITCQPLFIRSVHRSLLNERCTVYTQPFEM